MTKKKTITLAEYSVSIEAQINQALEDEATGKTPGPNHSVDAAASRRFYVLLAQRMKIERNRN